MEKYTIAQILAAWEAAYGEDMNEEYPGFIQRLSEENNEQKTRSTNGQGLPGPLAMARSTGTKLQAASLTRLNYNVIVSYKLKEKKV